jgi:hypothetical protein
MADFSEYTPEAQATLDVLTNAVIVARIHRDAIQHVANEPHNLQQLAENQMALSLALDQLADAVEHADEIRKAARN